MKKLRKTTSHKVSPAASIKAPGTTGILRKMRNSKKAFTLIEAAIAFGVLAIGLVSLQSVLRRGLVQSVRATDRERKTQIALSRIEEHKSQIYGNYVPNMVLPIVQPVASTKVTPAVQITPNVGRVDFATGTLTYSAKNMVHIDCTNNSFVTQTGYSVTFLPTPGMDSSYYYAAVATPIPSMTPGHTGYAWIDPPNRPPCDGFPGNIVFFVNVPPNVKGTALMTFVDYNATKRQQQANLNIYQKAYDPEATPMPSNPAAPSSWAQPLNAYDTESGVLGVTIAQSGKPNDWGVILEDGTNKTTMSALCLGASTPTKTPTPVAGCVNFDCTENYAYNFTRSGGMQLGGNQWWPNNQYFYTPSGAGLATRVINVTCTGVYRIRTNVRATSRWGGGGHAFNVTLTGTSVTSNFGVGTALWYPIVNGTSSNGFDDQFVTHSGATATWNINVTGNITASFSGLTADYPRVNWICLERIGALPTPTPAMVTTPTPTRTPTPMTGACTFNKFPVSLPKALMTPGAYYYGSAPVTYRQFHCGDSNLIALTDQGQADGSGKVLWQSGTGFAGYTFGATGKVYANVFLQSSAVAVTLTVKTTSTSVVATKDSIVGAPTYPGWAEIFTPDIAEDDTITKISVLFAGLSSSSTNYLGVDSIRAVNNFPVNPNATLKSFDFSVLSSYRDNVTYQPYIVDSNIEPMLVANMVTPTPNATPTPGAQYTSGYIISVVVHNGRYIGMVTPTPGGASPALVPGWEVTDQFPPVTITNTVSP